MRHSCLYSYPFLRNSFSAPKSVLVVAPGVKLALNYPPPKFWYRFWMRLFFGWVWEDPLKSGFS